MSAGGGDGRSGARDHAAFTFDSPQEVLPLRAGKHPSQMTVRQGEGGLAETKILEAAVGRRYELDVEIYHGEFIQWAGREGERATVWFSLRPCHRQQERASQENQCQSR